MTKARKSPVRSRRAPAKPARAGKAQVQWLLHELQVHSEEITVQNEQLIRAQTEIEQARDRYAELYDFAPVGYLALDLHGAIHECNFAASELLARPRRFLLTVPLSALITNEHRPILRDFLMHAGRDEDGMRAIEVQLKLPPQRMIRLFAKARPSIAGAPMLFTTMIDVTVERQLEGERREALAREQGRARELAIEVADRTRAQTRVKALLNRLVTVQEEERRRISRELHDELGQQLTALRLTLSMLRELGGDQEMHRQLDLADGITARLDRDVDHLAWALRPASLDELGLVPALDTFVHRWSENHRITATLDASPIGRLPGDVEDHLYRIVQEALNNIVKHAAATNASISLEQSDHLLRLAIHDNGHGFDPAAADLSGMGLVGMRERVALIGGDLTVDSHAGQGTTVSVRVPMSPTAS